VSIDLKGLVGGYHPDPWDVVKVRAGGTPSLRVIRSVGIAVADEQCAWLNRKSQRGRHGFWYEVRPSVEDS
jgi:hypothetical protein